MHTYLHAYVCLNICILICVCIWLIDIKCFRNWLDVAATQLEFGYFAHMYVCMCVRHSELNQIVYANRLQTKPKGNLKKKQHCYNNFMAYATVGIDNKSCNIVQQLVSVCCLHIYTIQIATKLCLETRH